MSQRVIKFRVWDTSDTPASMLGPYEITDAIFNHKKVRSLQLMQFTGKLCFNNREVYEGDILFYEEQEDDGDKRYYLVVVYVQEWCMFATLHIEEYHKYLAEGAKALDEVLYWTYPIEESEDYHYAGNIYENSNLLQS